MRNGLDAPSLNRFGGSFFQQFWDIIGSDVYAYVRQFFSIGWILPNMNYNVLALISKFPGANRIGDYRPIALAKFQFKIITEVLIDHLPLIDPKIVFEQQWGFIKGRNISECICIASETLNMLVSKSHGGNIALKLVTQ